MKWNVNVSGYDTVQFEALTKGAAMYRAYRAFCDAFSYRSFRDFLAIGVKVTKKMSAKELHAAAKPSKEKL